MRPLFPLFQSHLDLAHHYWQRLVHPGDYVIDATCGNGYDTLVLAKLALTADSGTLLALDIQECAVTTTRTKLQSALDDHCFSRVWLQQQSHRQFPKEVISESVQLIVYNLGYLPGGNKALTTDVDTVIASVEHALTLIARGGSISITAYPGHPEGAKECDALVELTARLDPALWSCCQHRWLNRQASPVLFLVQRSK